jgi:hypothetical protein
MKLFKVYINNEHLTLALGSYPYHVLALYDRDTTMVKFYQMVTAQTVTAMDYAIRTLINDHFAENIATVVVYNDRVEIVDEMEMAN